MAALSRIRRAIPADLDALLALEEATFATDRIRRAQWWRHIDSATASVLVSGPPEAIVAAAVVLYRRNARSARLYSLAVRASVRGSGIGAALLAASEADARARGCTSVRLEVAVDNMAAVSLYERHGYLRGARLPAYYADGGDAWRYVKHLVPVHQAR